MGPRVEGVGRVSQGARLIYVCGSLSISMLGYNNTPYLLLVPFTQGVCSMWTSQPKTCRGSLHRRSKTHLRARRPNYPVTISSSPLSVPRLQGLEQHLVFLLAPLLLAPLHLPQLLHPFRGECLARFAGRRSRAWICATCFAPWPIYFSFIYFLIKHVSVRGVEEFVAKRWNARSSSQRSTRVSCQCGGH
jgi:hypothetical protein